MVILRLSVKLERQIENYTERGDEPEQLMEMVAEMKRLIFEARARKAKKEMTGVEPNLGLSYKRICDILREELGTRIAIPPTPTTTWIVRLVLRVKELGVNEQQLREAARTAAIELRNTINIEFFVSRLPTFLRGSAEEGRRTSSEDATGSSKPPSVCQETEIVIGR